MINIKTAYTIAVASWLYLPKKKVNSDGQLLPTKEEDKQWWSAIPPI
jgi:hypothetical protein